MSLKNKPVLFCFLYILFLGCQTTKLQFYRAQDIESYREKRIAAVTLKSGDKLLYNETGGVYTEDKKDSAYIGRIVGFNEERQPQNIDLTDVLEVQTRSLATDGTSALLTALLVIGLTISLVFLSFFHGFKVG